MTVNVHNGEMDEKEIQEYKKYIVKAHPELNISHLDIYLDKDDPEYIDLKYQYTVVPFERIRRITGYLVGTLDRWNNGKRAEEHDRVKHGMIDDNTTYLS